MTAPAQLGTAGTWHDQAPAVAEAAREVLRLAPTDRDAPRLEDHAREACQAVDAYLGLRLVTGRIAYLIGGHALVTYAAGDVPADVVAAAVRLTVESYRRKDAPFGVSGAWSPSGEPVRISADHLAGVQSLLAPYRESWGFG